MIYEGIEREKIMQELVIAQERGYKVTLIIIPSFTLVGKKVIEVGEGLDNYVVVQDTDYDTVSIILTKNIVGITMKRADYESIKRTEDGVEDAPVQD